MIDQGVVWLTGLSGVGKTTVAKLVGARLAALGRRQVLLDGDRMRSLLPTTYGYTESERRKLAAYYGQLSAEIATQGHLVVCATVSMFHDIRAWNRANIPGYFEVWLRAPLTELTTRHGRAALYGSARTATDVVGLDTIAEFPGKPDLIVDNYGTTTAQDASEAIVAALHAARSA